MENYVDKTVANNTYYNRLYDNSDCYDFFLMHRSRRVAVVRMKITKEGVTPLRIKVFDKEYLPPRLMALNVPMKYIDEIGKADEQYREFLSAFKSWMNDRIIPVDRKDVKTLIKNLTGFTGNADMLYSGNDIAALQILSLFSYGRNMTDKYWFNPVRQTPIRFGSEANIFTKLGLNILQNDINLQRKKDFSGMDFIKNGFSKSFAENINEKETPAYHIQFNFPDLCTNGTIKKRWITVDDIPCLEKIYDSVDEAVKTIQLGEKLYRQFPDIFPKIYTVQDNPRAYYTECMLNGHTELVTFKDIKLLDAKQEFIDNAKAMNFNIDKISKICNVLNENGIDAMENAGIIIDCNSKEVEKYVAWV